MDILVFSRRVCCILKICFAWCLLDDVVLGLACEDLCVCVIAVVARLLAGFYYLFTFTFSRY